MIVYMEGQEEALTDYASIQNLSLVCLRSQWRQVEVVGNLLSFIQPFPPALPWSVGSAHGAC